jgi:uncharacterized membrane protein
LSCQETGREGSIRAHFFRRAAAQSRSVTEDAVQKEVAVALRAQREQGGAWRFELLPNRSSSWAQVKRFLLAVGLLHGLIAVGFASLGLWLVVPFSGLEVVALAAGLYVCSRASYRREVILLDAERLLVLRGHDRAEWCHELPRPWVRLAWEPERAGRASCLRLGSHGRFFEIGAFLIEAERRQLAGQLARLLGQPLGARAPEMAVDAGLNREMGL